MVRVRLERGGKLTALRWEKRKWEARDVTARAPCYLFENVELRRGVTLRDVFRLVRRHQPFFSVLFGRDVRAWVRAGLAAPKRRLGGYDPDGIEYLEVARYVTLWGKCRLRKGVLGPARTVAAHADVMVDFGGRGWKQRKKTETMEKGSRIPWALDFSKPADIVDLPILLSPVTKVSRIEQGTSTKPPELFEEQGLRLVDVLAAIFEELTFHGGPGEASRARSRVQKLAAEARKAFGE